MITTLSAQESTWVDAEGEGYTRGEAFLIARSNAIRQGAGERVFYALSIFEQLDDENQKVSNIRRKYLTALSNGLIVEEDTLLCELRSRGKGPQAEPYWVVQLRAKIVKFSDRDPYFKVDITVDPERGTYYDRQKVNIQIKANRDSYLTVFCLSSHNQMYLLIPNYIDTLTFVSPDTPILFETEMRVTEGDEEVSEQLFAIATKAYPYFVTINEIQDSLIFDETEDGLLILNPIGKYERFIEWLIELPFDQWTIDRVQYIITR